MIKLFKGNHNKTLTWLLLTLLLLLSFSISWVIYLQTQRLAQTEFDADVDDFAQSLQLRMNDHERLLLGINGLYSASESVERDEFHQYVNSLGISAAYPGIQIIGFSKWVMPNELTSAIESIRSEGFPQFNIHPLGVRAHYTMIVYAEPFYGTNLAAFGFDMFSEKKRRQAMSLAVEKNQAILTDNVILVQEKQGSAQAGILMYLPVFKKNMPLDSIDNRWRALDGFVYSAFRMEDLVKGILQQHKLNIDFTLYNGTTIESSNVLYDSHNDVTQNAKRNSAPRYEKKYPLELFGRTWLLAANSNKKFDHTHNFQLPIIALILGVIISTLLTMIFYVLAGQRQRALQLAERMTIDVRAKNKQLKNNQERFELALESSSMGVWSLDLNSNEMRFDNAMCTLFGLTHNNFNVTYETFLSALYYEDKQYVMKEIAQAIIERKGYDIEYRIHWSDGSIHYLASRAKIISDTNDDLTMMVMIGTCWDITERKQLDKLKNEFVSTVSHELRTPLTAILGALGVAINGGLGELPIKLKPIVDIAYKNSHRLTLLINDLLDMDKLLAGKLNFNCTPQLLMPLIERAIAETKPYADQMQIRFIICPTNSAPIVNVEDIRFLQVMANFLSNAAKFSLPNSNVEIKLNEVEGYVRVSVCDKGLGLDAASQTHIFEKFYQVDSSNTRKKGGTGLGLAISKEIVEKMNGRIGFVSVLGEGSTFYAEFPILR